ncbi:hypothetical protein JCM10212_001029 [Sporobolomyces blumeae]
MPLPSKKGKQKQVVIDFSSLDHAKASAPSSWDHDAWLDEGVRQEEQGERYQFGAKATRHFSNASTSFALAATLAPTDFDARYNAARVLYQLASNHLPPREAYDAIQRAIVGYREAIAVLDHARDDEDSTMARIDGMFNLAQANVALFEMIDERAVVDARAGTAIDAAREAKALFVEVERLQRIEMEKVFGAGGCEAATDETTTAGTGAEDDAASAAGSEQAVQAKTTTIVTPQLVLDTLLESISLDMSLHSSLARDPASQRDLVESTQATFERAVHLRTHALPNAPPELDVEMTLARFSIFSSPSSPDATALLERAISSTSDKASPALLSIYADHLVESVPVDEPLSAVEPRLERALATYKSVQAILSNRLSPPRDVPSYQIPLLVSSNLVAQSTVHLLSHHLLLRHTSPPCDSVTTTARHHLETAHALALEAISTLKSGLALTPSSTGPSLALACAPASTEPRTNLSTVVALRLAYFSLVRVRLRRPSPPTSAATNPSPLSTPDLEREKFWPTWNAVTNGSRKADDLRRADLEWWAEEIGDDKVMECLDPVEVENERTWWSSLLP